MGDDLESNFKLRVAHETPAGWRHSYTDVGAGGVETSKKVLDRYRAGSLQYRVVSVDRR